MEKFTDMTVSELESRCDEVLGELADIKLMDAAREMFNAADKIQHKPLRDDQWADAVEFYNGDGHWIAGMAERGRMVYDSRPVTKYNGRTA